jgi:hypothetical protein
MKKHSGRVRNGVGAAFRKKNAIHRAKKQVLSEIIRLGRQIGTSNLNAYKAYLLIEKEIHG